MAFSDMVAAAAEAERRQRRKARDALVEAAESTESPCPNSAEMARPDDSRSATISTDTKTRAPMSQAKAESQAINNNTEVQRQGQSTLTRGQVENSLRESKDYIATKEEENSRRQSKPVKTSRQQRDARQRANVPEVAVQYSKASLKSKIAIDAGQEREATREAQLVEVLLEDTFIAGTMQGHTRCQAIEPKAMALAAMPQEQAKPPRGIHQDSGAQQEDQATKTTKEATNASRRLDIPSLSRQDYAARITTEYITPDTKQSTAQVHTQNNNHRPSPLTALSLNGLIPKKRKKPSKFKGI